MAQGWPCTADANFLEQLTLRQDDHAATVGFRILNSLKRNNAFFTRTISILSRNNVFLTRMMACRPPVTTPYHTANIRCFLTIAAATVARTPNWLLPGYCGNRRSFWSFDREPKRNNSPSHT
jgi:hypothetical protein